jgi:hypothetical protein
MFSSPRGPELETIAFAARGSNASLAAARGTTECSSSSALAREMLVLRSAAGERPVAVVLHTAITAHGRIFTYVKSWRLKREGVQS